ncbi:alpha/beta hydrolase [Actinosynnema sp. NPDC020468]|uniref:alpha/beta fold hydrolase n=1 Tax=Actinosynnema sp. NPDC020468 TaxID=3154488 RepID=UPI0033D698C6
MDVVYVHGSCVTDAAWWWSSMVGPLASGGLRSVAVELPSCGDGGSFEDDVAAVTAAVEGPALLVGHSYGGMVATEAAARVAVAGLVYVAAVVPAAGESMGSLSDGPPPPFLDFGAEDVGAVASLVPPYFLQDCAADVVEGAVARLVRQSRSVFAAEASSGPAAPSWYVVCTEDRATVPSRQRFFAGRADHVVELASGHHPMLSRPLELASAILRAAEIVGGRR